MGCCNCCKCRKRRKQGKPKAPKPRFDPLSTCYGEPDREDDRDYAEYLRRQKRRKIIRDREYPDYQADWMPCLQLAPGSLSGLGSTSTSGDCPEEITVGSGLSLIGTTLSASGGSAVAGRSATTTGGTTTDAAVSLFSWSGLNIILGGIRLENTGGNTLAFDFLLTDLGTAFVNNASGTLLSGNSLLGPFDSFITTPLVSVSLAVRSNVPGVPTTYNHYSSSLTG